MIFLVQFRVKIRKEKIVRKIFSKVKETHLKLGRRSCDVKEASV